MNIQRFHIDIDLRLRKVSANVEGNLLTEEVDIYINRAINQFIKKTFDLQRKDGQEFEDSQKATDDLRSIHVRMLELLTYTYNPVFMAREYQLPENYMYLTQDYTKTNHCTNRPFVPNRLTRTENLHKVLDNPYETTHPNSPISNLFGNTLIVYSLGKFDIQNVWIDYIRKPAVVKLALDVQEDLSSYNPSLSVECDLPEHTHDEIVDIAVDMIVGDLMNPHKQVTSNDNMLNLE
jgi:hypothetical protein